MFFPLWLSSLGISDIGVGRFFSTANIPLLLSKLR